jgi:GNAT superfamily N-acetyltransferase
MSAGIHLRRIGLSQRHLLVAMYDGFDPLGAALGLPPHTAEARRKWVGSALCDIVNVAAFSAAGQIVGHAFLAPSSPGSAEIAVFVHQDFRRRGIGAALLRKALELGREADVQHAWAVTSSENRTALRFLIRCGFRQIRSDFDVTELEIDLRVPPEAGEPGWREEAVDPGRPETCPTR